MVSLLLCVRPVFMLVSVPKSTSQCRAAVTRWIGWIATSTTHFSFFPVSSTTMTATTRRSNPKPALIQSTACSLRRSSRLASAAATMMAASTSLPRVTHSFIVASTPPRRIVQQLRKVTPMSSEKTPTKPKRQTSAKNRRTQSFDALWHGSLPQQKESPTEPHTLILGTHPSVKSLEQQRYFGHDMK
jgi:hypothetical protein